MLDLETAKGSLHFPFSNMLGSGFNKQKLKVNLKLAINRLKLLEKKKSKFVSYSMLFRHLLLLLHSTTHLYLVFKQIPPSYQQPFTGVIDPKSLRDVNKNH